MFAFFSEGHGSNNHFHNVSHVKILKHYRHTEPKIFICSISSELDKSIRLSFHFPELLVIQQFCLFLHVKLAPPKVDQFWNNYTNIDPFKIALPFPCNVIHCLMMESGTLLHNYFKCNSLLGVSLLFGEEKDKSLRFFKRSLFIVPGLISN